MLKRSLTRKNISNIVHQNLGFSKNISLLIIDDFFESLVSELIKLNKIKISTFGTFEIINKKERIGCNPKTRVETKITARKVIKFKPSNKIKLKLNH